MSDSTNIKDTYKKNENKKEENKRDDRKDEAKRDDYRKDSGGRGKGSDRSFRGGGKGKMFFKRKVCRFCVKKLTIDYKDADLLKKFTTERGKIIPRRILGTCARHQRKLTRAIKRARVVSIMPFVSSSL